MKRLFDVFVSFFGLLCASPVLLPVMFLVWWQDKHSPFYIAQRVGKKGEMFAMVKMRSMVVNADSSGVDSTSANDCRITSVGRFIRRFKVDEVTQLWNVLKGDMSLVGPRPNVPRDVALYTDCEKDLLSVRPGITDISSIVFADEGEILKDSPDPDLKYNQVIRPWKSRLGLLYIERRTFFMDLKLIYLTLVSAVSRSKALASVCHLLQKLKVDDQVIAVARRDRELTPFPPPGANEVVQSRGAMAS